MLRSSINVAWILLCGLNLIWPAAWAAPLQIAVITALKAAHLTFNQDTLRNVYLKHIFVDSGGVKLIPVNLPKDAVVRDAFAHIVLRMFESRMENYWDKQYFQGISPPYVLASDEAVIQFMTITPGAIGYVGLCHANASVRVVMLLPWPKTMANEPEL